MKNYSVKKCTLDDIEKIIKISKETFYETFIGENSKEDVEKYIKESFSYKQIKSEIENRDSIFYIVEVNEDVIEYMKVNFEGGQTEKDHNNTLEVQRIYILEEYKGKNIGKLLIEEAKSTARKNFLRYIWLGVWEKIIMQ